jgi:hypothetical protein
MENQIKHEKKYWIYKTKQMPLGSIYTCFTNCNCGNAYTGDVFYNNLAKIRLVDMQDYIKRGYFDVYSVKRLSDGEVFTIGDVCVRGVITGFSVGAKGTPFIGGMTVTYKTNESIVTESINHINKSL